MTQWYHFQTSFPFSELALCFQTSSRGSVGTDLLPPNPTRYSMNCTHSNLMTLHCDTLHCEEHPGTGPAWTRGGISLGTQQEQRWWTAGCLRSPEELVMKPEDGWAVFSR